MSQIYPSYNCLGHECILLNILIEIHYSVGIEIPVWMRHENHFLTDLIQVIDGTIYVADYKPEETPDITTNRISYSFMRSVPQVASYALVLKKVYGNKDIKCMTFNKKFAWIYERELMLISFNGFIKKFKQFKVKDRPWEKYFLK